MAVIESSNLKVEIKFTDYAYDWVNYSFTFTYASQPVFNPAITEKSYFFANEDDKDYLIKILEEALAADKDLSWVPIEPDIYIETRFFPKRGWLATQNDKTIVYTSPEQKEKLIGVDELRSELKGKLLDDYFELTFMVDVYRLKDLLNKKDSGYTSDYIGLRMVVTRQELADFVRQLKQEYEVYRKKYNILE